MPVFSRGNKWDLVAKVAAAAVEAAWRQWLRSTFSLKWHLKEHTFALGTQYSVSVRGSHKCPES